jgi:LPXTG-site transpeptidase (sortase) family protein
VHRRRLVALLLILVGGTLAIDARAVIRFGDGIAARAHARETMKWIRANDAAGDAGRAAPSQARGSVIAPGREGYLLLIPRIGVRLVVRELEVEVFSGRNTPTLRRHGLGQVPYTHQLRNVSPGGDGTAAITGHRTTSGAPFRNIDRLRPGDLIIIRKGSVEQQWAVEGSAVVPPSAVGAIKSRPGTKRLVLLACTPPFTARERLVVKARLKQETASTSLAPEARSGR